MAEDAGDNSSPEIKYGLAGVYTDTSNVSQVNWETNSLIYRGYPVQELCAQCSFEEVAYLLLFGALPNRSQLDDFTREERRQRAPGQAALEVIRLCGQAAHPMESLRTGVSFLGTQDPDADNLSDAALKEKSVALLAQIPTLIAADYRYRNAKQPLEPDPSLSISENFFHMCFGRVPEREVIRAFDISLILYAEHSFNASTFAARVINSTLSDIYSAVAGAIGALKGPLHGGANEAVMEMMLEIGAPEKAGDWLRAGLAERRKIMGFGHRVYRHGDSRVPTMHQALEDMAAIRQGGQWLEMYRILEETMMAEKGIYPNLDFPAGPAYYLMGFEIPMFTPIFVISRITGWAAHIMEQAADNKLIRPLSHYTGPDERSVPALAERG